MDLRDDREEDRRRLLERELDGGVVRCLGFAGFNHGLEQGRSALAERQDALQRIDDVGGLNLAAVVEPDAFAQLECVGEAVLRDGVALGDPGLELGRVRLPAHQTIVDVEAHGNATDVEGDVRVHGVEVALVGEDEAGLRHSSLAEASQEREARDASEDKAAYNVDSSARSQNWHASLR